MNFDQSVDSFLSILKFSFDKLIAKLKIKYFYLHLHSSKLFQYCNSLFTTNRLIANHSISIKMNENFDFELEVDFYPIILQLRAQNCHNCTHILMYLTSALWVFSPVKYTKLLSGISNRMTNGFDVFKCSPHAKQWRETAQVSACNGKRDCHEWKRMFVENHCAKIHITTSHSRSSTVLLCAVCVHWNSTRCHKQMRNEEKRW